MKKEDYELLVRECCNRLPYGVMVVLNGIYGKLKNIEVTHYYNDTNEVQEIKAYTNFFQPNEPIDIENFKLVLRPMADMTEHEKEIEQNIVYSKKPNRTVYDFFKSRHLDYNGLIPKGIAIDSTDLGIYGNLEE